MSSLKKPLTYLSMVAFFTGALAVAPAQAGSKHKHHHHGHHHILKKLDLSEEQKAQIKEIKMNAKTEKKALYKSIKEYKSALKELVKSDNYSEQAVRSLHAQYQSVFADKAVLKANMYNQIEQVLTDEQKAKRAQIKEKMKKHWAEKKKRMKERQSDSE
ncbi:Spy/CpxP family protein refolding chaperone [Kangiella shandongensis]|uniref:Spy/CpxP family protein refolding chaperone n=1 Tax=Kangiella shandongensis TaxID=2763258 RepID=UPI001CBC1EF8|nr:Spy/CpxP family protein refolding chaperone [Kangiella shandongensis]